MEETMKFQVVDYYDVWGNEVDGWDVNGISREDCYVDLVFDNTDDEIIRKLVAVGYLNKEAEEALVYDIAVDWLDDTMIELTLKENGLPLGRLEKVEN